MATSAVTNGVQSDAKRSRGKLKVAIVDDHPAIRQALAAVLQSTSEYTASWQAESASDAFQLIERDRPDVAIIDIVLGDADGLDLVKNLCTLYPELHVVVFSMYDELVYAERAIRAGASGYLMKDKSTKAVLEAIRRVVAGEVSVAPRVAAHMFAKMNSTNGTSKGKLADLTDREIAVFQMLGQGHDITEIASRLSLSRKTVETYRRRAKEKLGYDSIAELLQHAVEWVYGMA